MAEVGTGQLNLDRLADDNLFWDEIGKFCRSCLKGENKKFCDREKCLIHFICKQFYDKQIYYLRGIKEGISRVDDVLTSLKKEIDKIKQKQEQEEKKVRAKKKEPVPPKLADADEPEEDEDGEEEI